MEKGLITISVTFGAGEQGRLFNRNFRGTEDQVKEIENDIEKIFEKFKPSANEEDQDGGREKL